MRLSRFLVPTTFGTLFVLVFVGPSRAAPANYILDNEPAPDSVKETPSPMGYGFLKELRPEFVFRRLKKAVKKQLEPLPPFFRDTSLSVKVRNYYFNRANIPRDNRVAWAMGGWVNYRSGWAFERFRLGVNWYTLCIGDAAHAMSPIGGVGVNLAVQDAVATANILAARLRSGSVTLEDLHKVQQRREFPARATQKLQVFVQNTIIAKVLASKDKVETPIGLKIAQNIPALRYLAGRMVGLGLRPEHIATPDIKTSLEYRK